MGNPDVHCIVHPSPGFTLVDIARDFFVKSLDKPCLLLILKLAHSKASDIMLLFFNLQLPEQLAKTVVSKTISDVISVQ